MHFIVIDYMNLANRIKSQRKLREVHNKTHAFPKEGIRNGKTKDALGPGVTEGRSGRASVVTPMGVARKNKVLHRPNSGFIKL